VIEPHPSYGFLTKAEFLHLKSLPAIAIDKENKRLLALARSRKAKWTKKKKELENASN
jgi:hypothetical protein